MSECEVMAAIALHLTPNAPPGLQYLTKNACSLYISFELESITGTKRVKLLLLLI